MVRNSTLIQKIDVSEGGDKYPVQLRVERGPVIRGRILDPDGRPLSGGRYTGRDDHPRPQWWPLDGGKFYVVNFDASRPRQLMFVHPERKLTGELALKEKPDAELTVRLQPWGTVTGRCVVDREGVGIDDLKIVAGSAESVLEMTMPQPGKAMMLRVSRFPLPPAEDGHTQIKTDREGRFVIAGLLPRVKYDLSGQRHSATESLYGDIASDLTLSPGETRDLGTIELKPADLQKAFNRQQDGAKNESK